MKQWKSILVIIVIAGLSFIAYAQTPKVIRPGAQPQKNADKIPVPYPYVRDADVMWSKRIWRVINLKEKFNHPLYYPSTPIADRKSLFDVLKDGALQDTTVSCYSPTNDEFTIKLTKSELEALLINWDSSATTEDPVNPGNMIPAPVKKEITSEDITKYWIKEDWFFDKQRSVMEVRIIGILVLTAKKTESGEDAGGDKPLFWVYFPEIRPVLANSDVYMRHNDAERRSLDDIFMKRMFSSYIVKESNVYDRYIGDYTMGVNALLESERVKEDVFNFEHDLWHY
ncbi:MAG: gliding motility protein GldN [Bacteroidota bacterium]